MFFLKIINYNFFFKKIEIICINRRVLFFLGELAFEGRWASKLTKGEYNSLNWVEGYEIVMDKYTL